LPLKEDRLEVRKVKAIKEGLFRKEKGALKSDQSC